MSRPWVAIGSILGLVVVGSAGLAYVALAPRPLRAIVVHGVPASFSLVLRTPDRDVSLRSRGTTFTGRAAIDEDDALALVADGPCGELTLPTRRIDSYGLHDRIEVEAERVEARRVLVDTRDASPRFRLTIGQQRISLPAGVHQELEIPVASCAMAHDVGVEGRPVGRLPDDASLDVLVDVAGTHCYRIDEADRESIVLLTIDETAPTRATETLAAAHVHVLARRIDFPFVPVPASVDLDELGHRDDIDGHYAITSLVTAPCDQASAPK